MAPYIVKPGDSLSSIAAQFQSSPEQIMAKNGLRSPLIMVGQTLHIPSMNQRQMTYRPVTAYTATEPILVNGVNINTGLYPVLNYKPENAQYPYIYVPIAEFSRVGAKVTWNEAQQLLTVTSDYQTLKSEVTRLRSENQELRELLAAYGPAPQQGNTSGNIANWGLVASQGDWFYFSNTTDNSRLYRMRFDGTGEEPLTDEGVLYVNVLGNWIYYISRSDNRMYKIQLDGSNLTLIDPDHAATVMVVSGDWIYYITQSAQYRIYKIRTDGTGKTMVSDEVRVKDMYVFGDWIFYTVEPDLHLFRIRTDGTNRLQVTNEPVDVFNVVGEYVYYVTRYLPVPGIVRVNWDGSNKISYSTNQYPRTINVPGDGWIYYYTDKLYKRNLDANETVPLESLYDYSGQLNVAGDSIFFDIFYNGQKFFRMRKDGTGGTIL